MENTLNIVAAAKGLSHDQKSIIRTLFQCDFPVAIQFFDTDKTAIFQLQDRELILIQNRQVSLTALGIGISEYWQSQKCNGLKIAEISVIEASRNQQKLETSDRFLDLYKQGLSYQDIGKKYGLGKGRVSNILESNPRFQAYVKEREEVCQQQRIDRSNQFLELYKQGLSYRSISKKCGLSESRVRGILKKNLGLQAYLKECQEAKVTADLEKQEKLKINLWDRSIANCYPERTATLWDYEKNHDLDPKKTLAHSSVQIIWLKCPIDGHSWKKKVAHLTTLWERNGRSGCPVCAGRIRKSKKQPTLVEAYTDFVERYWNYDKNSKLDLDPSIITLGSNKKAWFKCPEDGNEWQVNIGATIAHKWSKGNAGCQVCNGK